MNMKRRNEVVAIVANGLSVPAVRSIVLRELFNANKERLANLEHEQWAHWTKYMLDNLTPENIERWSRQIETSYEDLSEAEKASDREWADKVIEMVMSDSEDTSNINGGKDINE